MRSVLVFAGLALAVGCSSGTDRAVTPPVITETEDSVAVEKRSSSSAAVSDGTEIAISPENTLIQFVGTHVGPTPDPNARTGKFGDFTGVAVIADDDLKSVVVDIKTGSLETPIENLTNHLKSEDFFSVREYPTARFASTTITRNEEGDHMITGNLTLHGETMEISFPASVGMPDGELNLSAKIKLDRTEFGMTSNTEKVNKEVNLTIGIGKSAEEAVSDQVSDQTGEGGGGRGGFDPEAMFAQRDTNGDGKLTEDEMHDRMKERLADIDTDGDKAVSLEEMKVMFANFRGGGRGPRNSDE